MSTRQAVQDYGTNANKEEFKQNVWPIRDTLLLKCGATLGDVQLFQWGDKKDHQYRSNEFPSNSQAYNIHGIQLFTDIRFEGANHAEKTNKLAHFIDNSFIEFRMENSDVTKIPLRECINMEIIPDPTISTATAPKAAIRSKFTNFYPLQIPIKVGAGAQFDVWLRPAKGLTTEAYDSTNGTTPIKPGSFLDNSEHGFSITINLMATKILAVS